MSKTKCNKSDTFNPNNIFDPTDPDLANPLNSAIFEESDVNNVINGFDDEECILISIVTSTSNKKNFSMVACDQQGTILASSPTRNARFPCPDDCDLFTLLTENIEKQTYIDNIFCIKHVRAALNQNDVNGLAIHSFTNGLAKGLGMYATKTVEVSEGEFEHTRYNDISKEHKVYEAI